MSKILKMLSVLFVLMFSMTFALSDEEGFANYRLKVIQVDPEFNCFSLSNGMVLTTIQREWRFEELPEIGTEIYVDSKIRFSRDAEEKVKEGEFWITYLHEGKKKLLLGWMSAEPDQKMLTYVSTKLECTQPAGLIFSEVHENVIELSDGSKWISQKVPHFDPGTRILVTPDQKSENWYLMDIGTERFLQTNRILLIYYSRIEVKPYLPGSKE